MKSIRTKIIIATLSIFTFYSCGSKQPAESIISVVDTEQVSYSNHIKVLTENYCVSCHSGKKPAAKLSLVNYTEVRNAAEKGSLMKRINDHENPMPYRGLMTTGEREIFDRWVSNGYLEQGK